MRDVNNTIVRWWESIILQDSVHELDLVILIVHDLPQYCES